MLKGQAMLLERSSHLSQRHVVNTLESRLNHMRHATLTLWHRARKGHLAHKHVGTKAEIRSNHIHNT